MQVADLLNGWCGSLLSYIVGNPGMCMVLYRSEVGATSTKSYLFPSLY
jgi:hypothetical protein